VDDLGWELVARGGAPLDAATPLDGIVTAVPAAALSAGDRLVIRRTSSCLNPTGDPVDLRDDEVVVTVGAEAARPEDAGRLTVASGSRGSTAVLALSPSVVPWLHMITQGALQVGTSRFREGVLVDGADRDLGWTLASGGCRSCPAPSADPGGAPTVCQAHQWPPGEYDVVAEIELADESTAIRSNVVSTRFDALHCSN
jgi:hypothetical protein